MSYIDKEIATAINNLNSVSKTAVPRASARSLNKVTTKVVRLSVRDTSKKIRVPQKIVKPRIKVVKAKVKLPVSYIKVRRGNIPAISLGSARTQIRRQRGQYLVSQAQRDSRGRYAKRKFSGNTSIKVGRHIFHNAFLQKLKNGRWHIMQRTTDKTYPIKVVSIPLSQPITRSFQAHSNRMLQSEMPKELKQELARQLKIVITKR